MAEKKKVNLDQIVVLKDVRLSFPHLFEPQERENDDGTKRKNYNCALLIPKDHPQVKTMLAAFKKAATAARKKAWGDDPVRWPNVPSHQVALKDGDNPDHTDRPEYEGHYFLNASAPVDRPPRVLTNRKDSNNRWIKAEQGEKGAVYAGCFVNSIIEIWGQKKDSKKNMPNRINAGVQTVQFRRDGDPFTVQPVDPNDLLDDDDVSTEGEIGDDDDGDDGDGLI